MSRRVLVTIHLPLEMGSVAGILRAASREWPDAVVGEGPADEMRIIADDSAVLTKSQRRAMAKRGVAKA